MPRNLPAIFSRSIVKTVLQLVALGLIDIFAISLMAGLIDEGDTLLAGFVLVVTLGINAAFLIPGLYPYRWFSPGLTLLIVVLIYPTVFTVYVAFTNYKTGNLFSHKQAEEQLLKNTYLPADAPLYTWTAFKSSEGDSYALWLIPANDQAAEPGLATEGDFTPSEEVDLGGNTLDEDGIPTGLPGYERLARGQAISLIDSVLTNIEFGESESAIRFNPKNPSRQAGVFRAKYELLDGGSLLDNETGVTYEPVEGTYTPVSGPLMMDGKVVDEDGKALEPLPGGFYVITGLDNIRRLFTDDRVRGPFVRVFIWTFAHAFFTVFLTFWLGLGLAIVMNSRFFPGRAILRTALLIPYSLPAFISVLIWRGLLNENLGVVNKGIESLLGVAGPHWLNDPNWVKVGILLVQLWLGFPYMMLITTGALQSIPGDIYEAARVDGANAFQQFRHLTLPLLLVAVGPLLIASFAFNFNNFTVVELFADGGPAISPDTPAGHSDILITYTYQLAFGSSRGADYGFASTISIAIFLIVATITFFNFRFTRTWEEISENV